MKPPYEIVARCGLTKRVGVDRVKRQAIRRCRALTRKLGAGAAGSVRREGFGLVYQVAAWDYNGRVVLKVEEL